MKIPRMIVVSICAGSLFLATSAGRAIGQQADSEKPKKDKDYEALVIERDNLLAQAKKLLEYKTRYTDLEAQLKKSQLENDGNTQRIKQLETTLAETEQKYSDDKQGFDVRSKSLEGSVADLQKDNAKLKNSLEKVAIEYKIIPETKKELARLQAEQKDLTQKSNLLDMKVKTLESKGLDKDAQIEVQRSQIKEYKKRYEQAMAKNRIFERKSDQLPVKFAEMARENKVLIKETALMHYNLGVFYTKNKEYSRSIAEFEKAIELNPEDPYSNYNLGYIYAEYQLDRPKAIENFKKYLSLLKTDDKDSDWVKKYILTWQTWEGKKPVN